MSEKTQNVLSIICSTYNHEKYVAFFLDSLLAQTNPNWELIIVDDCSTDNNVGVIKKYADKRIKLIQNPFNMGINCGLNTAFQYTYGQLISFCASDDMLKPDYVENVFNHFASHKDNMLLYTNLELIDNNNNPRNQIFYNQRGDRYSVLHELFMSRNTMLSPGMVIRRDLFKKILPLDIPLSQYQDYKMHIDLLLQSDFMVMDTISVLYRKHDSQAGLSAINDITEKRRHLEENLLMDSFLAIKDVALLKDIFKTELDAYGTISDKTIPFVLGMLALNSPEEYKKLWGYRQIVAFINTTENYELVNKLYGFEYKDFLKLASKFNNDPIKAKYRKYKKLFNISLVVWCFMLMTIIFLAI